MSTGPQALTGSKKLGSNMLWNLFGMGLPIFVALLAIPSLIGLLGEARFGVLTIAWLVFGYFSIFDLGLHRALTQIAARALGESKPEQITGLFWTSLAMMAGAGVVGGIVVYGTSHIMVDHLNIPLDLPANLREQIRQETLSAFALMALGLPVLTSTAGLRGILEAHQKFKCISMIQLWHGTWTFLGPLLIAWLFTPDLSVIVAGLVAGRLITWTAYFVFATRAAPQVWHRVRFDPAYVIPLLSFGGWMTLTHAVVPVILYGDRFIVGTIIDTEAVTHYVTPAEIVVKLLIIPNAIIGVLFPAFSMTFNQQRRRTAELFSYGVQGSLFLLLPIAIVGVTLAPEVLKLWLSLGMQMTDASAFAADSAPVLQILIIGVLINGCALVPTSLVQAAGRPAWVAIAYCIQLPLWYYSMMWLTQHYGIVGTATVWSARQLIDLVMMLLMCRYLMRVEDLKLFKPMLLLSIVCVSATGMLGVDVLAYRLLGAVILLLTVVCVGWFFVIESSQKALLVDTVQRFRKKTA